MAIYPYLTHYIGIGGFPLKNTTPEVRTLHSHRKSKKHQELQACLCTRPVQIVQIILQISCI